LSYTAPTWYLLAHSGNVETGDSSGQIKIAGINVTVKDIGTSAYHADSYFALASHGNHVPTYPTSNTSAYFLRGDNVWSNILTSRHSKSIATFNAINNSDDAWNKSGNFNLRLSANNNCLVITVGGILNDRNAYI